jgi:hypothetical protein
MNAMVVKGELYSGSMMDARLRCKFLLALAGLDHERVLFLVMCAWDGRSDVNAAPQNTEKA